MEAILEKTGRKAKEAKAAMKGIGSDGGLQPHDSGKKQWVNTDFWRKNIL